MRDELVHLALDSDRIVVYLYAALYAQVCISLQNVPPVTRQCLSFYRPAMIVFMTIVQVG